jgi:hypothetical protein
VQLPNLAVPYSLKLVGLPELIAAGIVLTPVFQVLDALGNPDLFRSDHEVVAIPALQVLVFRVSIFDVLEARPC